MTESKQGCHSHELLRVVNVAVHITCIVPHEPNTTTSRADILRAPRASVLTGTKCFFGDALLHEKEKLTLLNMVTTMDKSVNILIILDVCTN